MDAFLAVTVAGLVAGSVYALSAAGLVLTYTTSGVLNLANGAVGMVVAFAYWQLRVGWGVPGLPALLLAVLVVAPAVGVALERLVRASLVRGALAAQVVVPVALLVGLVGVAQLVWDPATPRTTPPLLPGVELRVAGVLVSGDQLLALALAAAVALLVGPLVLRSGAGTAMRAVVDDPRLAALTGVRPERLAGLSWALGAALAGLAGILLSRLVTLEALILSLLVIDALGAAALGALRSVVVAFGGALVIGLSRAYVVAYLPSSEGLTRLKNALPALLLLAVVLLRADRALRPDGRAAVPPVPPGWARPVAGATALVAAGAVVAGWGGDRAVNVAAVGLAYAVVLLSLVLLTGWGGQVSLCQMTFAGTGALAMGHLGPGRPVVGLLLAAATAAGLGALVALVAVRVQGLPLALATLGVAATADGLVFADSRLFDGGSLAVPLLLPGERAALVAIALTAGGVVLGLHAVRRGRWGRLLVATRDSSTAAAALQVHLSRVRLATWAAAAALAGLGGALLGGVRTTVAAGEFAMVTSLPVLLLAVLGGITTLTGAVLGGLALARLPVLASQLPGLASAAFLAAGLVAVVLGRLPEGVVGAFVRRSAGGPPTAALGREGRVVPAAG